MRKLIQFIYKSIMSVWDFLLLIIYPKAFNDKVINNKLVHNPILALPKNFPCLCLSGRKVKNCCARQRMVTKQVADKIELGLSTFEKKYNVNRKTITLKDLNIGNQNASNN